MDNENSIGIIGLVVRNEYAVMIMSLSSFAFHQCGCYFEDCCLMGVGLLTF